jgi:hypothetical protein
MSANAGLEHDRAKNENAMKLTHCLIAYKSMIFFNLKTVYSVKINVLIIIVIMLKNN